MRCAGCVDVPIEQSAKAVLGDALKKNHTINPGVLRSGQVVLDIEQEVSTVGNTTTSGIDSPTILTRKIETSVAVSNGQTIAFGCLIEERRNRMNSKVPGAGDVPILGAVFRNRKDTDGRTELLVLIPPRVIRDGGESREIKAELRDRITGANGLVRNGVATPSTGHRIIDQESPGLHFGTQPPPPGQTGRDRPKPAMPITPIRRPESWKPGNRTPKAIWRRLTG